MDADLTVGSDDHGRTILRFSGALDLQSRNLLTGIALSSLQKPDLVGVVVDLADVGFIDSSGLGALVEIAGAAEDAGASFALANPSTRVMRLLAVTGLTSSWTVEATDARPK